jgi:hypothetical protein
MFIVRKCSTTEHQHDPKKSIIIFVRKETKTFYLVIWLCAMGKRLLAYSVYGTCPHQERK